MGWNEPHQQGKGESGLPGKRVVYFWPVLSGFESLLTSDLRVGGSSPSGRAIKGISGRVAADDKLYLSDAPDRFPGS
jgi:hypothetical protein